MPGCHLCRGIDPSRALPASGHTPAGTPLGRRFDPRFRCHYAWHQKTVTASNHCVSNGFWAILCWHQLLVRPGSWCHENRDTRFCEKAKRKWVARPPPLHVQEPVFSCTLSPETLQPAAAACQCTANAAATSRGAEAALPTACPHIVPRAISIFRKKCGALFRKIEMARGRRDSDFWVLQKRKRGLRASCWF